MADGWTVVALSLYIEEQREASKLYSACPLKSA